MKVESLTPRQDSLGDLVDLGSSEDEDNVSGRFFQRFQECIPSIAREHMHLVDDINAVFRSCRSEGDLFDDAADVVDTTVRSGVHLDDVQDLAAVDAETVLAYAAGVTVVRVKTVDGLR